MLSTNPVTARFIKARELIADEKNWCQFAMCRPVGRGWQYCAVGALAEQGADTYSSDFEFLDDAARALFGMRIATVNDQLGHAAVMRCFDRAVERTLLLVDAP